MSNTKSVRVGIVGVGNMGRLHARDVHDLANTELVAVCDRNPARAEATAAQFGVEAYYDYADLLDHPGLDGVIIAAPHYDHTPMSIAALRRGVHVLVEKPIAVHAKDACRMIDAYEAAGADHPDLVFAAMFMQRTYGHFRKIKDLIEGGELGKLVRSTWITTDSFRPQIYYDSGDWRATWAGEGGGVLLNQSPHQLDLYQWFFGAPDRVTGFASLGKYHDIEVEDEVTAYFQHRNGMVGHFITTTAEAPGTNRLEIAAERGKLVLENDEITFYRNRRSMLEFIVEATGSFEKVEHQVVQVPFEHHGEPGHRLVIENFANAILRGEPLIAPAAEGLWSVMMGNAIILSSFLGKTLAMPIDEDAYEAKLIELIAGSRYQKVTREASEVDLSKSFG